MQHIMHGELNPTSSHDDRVGPRAGIDATTCVEESDAMVDQLQAVLDDVQYFLADWCHRLDQCVTPLSNANVTPDAILQKRIDEFRREQRLQQSVLQAEKRALQRKADELAAAWLRLEAEQREFLQMKASSNPVRDLKPATDPPRIATQSSISATPVKPPTAASPSQDAREESVTETRPAMTAKSRDTAIRQFQQLRREIEASRPNPSQSFAASETHRRPTGG